MKISNLLWTGAIISGASLASGVLLAESPPALYPSGPVAIRRVGMSFCSRGSAARSLRPSDARNCAKETRSPSKTWTSD